MLITAKERAIEYAKNYPLAKTDAGLFGPITVANVGAYNGRTIVNLCLKTTRSEPSNASISFPSDWTKAKRFRSGDLVNVLLEGGYVRNIWPAKPTAATSSKSTMNETISSEPVETHETKVLEDRPF